MVKIHFLMYLMKMFRLALLRILQINFFFDPFHLKIFIKVIQNIEESLKRNRRDVSFFLYKPDKSIIKYLDTLKSFHKEILIESNFSALNKEYPSVPQFALYSNFSMTHTVNQYSFNF